MKLRFKGSILLKTSPEQIVSNKLLKSFFGSDNKALGGFHGFGWKSININTFNGNMLF